MPPQPPPARADIRARARAGLCLAALLLAAAPAPARAWPEERDAPPRARPVARARPVPRPAAVFSGYLPRNNNVPLYNEPPRTRTFGPR